MNYKVKIKAGESKALWGGEGLKKSDDLPCMIVLRIDNIDEGVKLKTLNKNNGQDEVYEYGNLNPDETYSLSSSDITAIIAEAHQGDTTVSCTIMNYYKN